MNKFAIVDERASIEIIKNINNLGYKVVFNKAFKEVSKSCSSHPDISFFRISENKLIYAPGSNQEILNVLSNFNIRLIAGNQPPKSTYPEEVRYNACVIGKNLFHKLDATDSVILSEAEKKGLNLINVNQGYTKCSICKIRDDLIITSDIGIHKAAMLQGIKSLLIPPQKNIRLEGVDYGFIGGATGRIDDNTIAIAGNAKKLESYYEIKAFLDMHNVKLISLGSGDVEDLGTIFFFTL